MLYFLSLLGLFAIWYYSLCSGHDILPAILSFLFPENDYIIMSYSIERIVLVLSILFSCSFVGVRLGRFPVNCEYFVILRETA